MAFVPRPGSFTLFKNVRKVEGSKMPDYSGDGLDIDGNAIEIAAWVREGAKGKFMSCTIKPKTATQPPKQYAPPPDDDQGIPF